VEGEAAVPTEGEAESSSENSEEKGK